LGFAGRIYRKLGLSAAKPDDGNDKTFDCVHNLLVHRLLRDFGNHCESLHLADFHGLTSDPERKWRFSDSTKTFMPNIVCSFRLEVDKAMV
jgi:hypothetical protein